jgi:hypothetical protein
MRPDDLRGSAREAYNMWRRLGLSEQSAMGALEQDGAIQLSEGEKLARRFQKIFYLSEAEARRAVDGREGPRPRAASHPTPSGRSSAGHEPGDALRLVGKIEDDQCRRGVPEEEALREAAFAVFETAPDSVQDWVAQVIGRRWPGLWRRPGPSGVHG